MPCRVPTAPRRCRTWRGGLQHPYRDKSHREPRGRCNLPAGMAQGPAANVKISGPAAHLVMRPDESGLEERLLGERVFHSRWARGIAVGPWRENNVRRFVAVNCAA